MDRSLAIIFILAAGIAQPLQAVLNSHLAKNLSTPVWAASISAAITSVTLAVLALTMFRLGVPSPRVLLENPFFTIAGGLVGSLILGAMTAVTPKLGATVTFLCFVAGVTVSSVLLDQLGTLGLPQQSLTLWRGAGVVLIICGVAVIRLF